MSAVTPEPATASAQACLRVVPGFQADEADDVVGLLHANLDRRLSRFTADEVEMEISCKDRGTDHQRVTLEVWIRRGSEQRFVATAKGEVLRDLLLEVRDDMRRQINRALERKEKRRTR